MKALAQHTHPSINNQQGPKPQSVCPNWFSFFQTGKTAFVLIFLNQNEQSHESSQKKTKQQKISYIPDQLKPDESSSGRASFSLPTTQLQP